VKKSFVTGLVIWLPLALTAALTLFIVNFLTRPFVGFVESQLLAWEVLPNGLLLLSQQQIHHYTSQFLILALLFFFTLALGFFARWFFFHSLLNLGNKLVHSIPFVNKVYKTSQDVITTLFQSQSEAFTQVVVVPFPNQTTLSLGLVTREAPPVCSDAVNEQLISVFVPTTPNPTSGYLLMLRQKDIIYLDMPIEDAVKFIISVGVIHPEKKGPVKPPQTSPASAL
jgi:uncharacterized membrane protein